ncbi:MAG: hypothetical protein MR762_12800 [Clostridiales bacterium]|nr:hypothetical protein [Clostridiales bacterium]
MYDRLDYHSSAELCKQMAQECDTAILAFSTGKDSIAAWLQMRKYFKRIVPYYCYSVPGLEFVEKSLAYYEDFFETHIYRLPHRSLYRWLRGMVFQSPPHVTKVEALDLPGEEYDDAMIGELVRELGHLPDGAYVGTGVRMADSPMRRVGLMTHGCINHSQKRFYPVYDWKKADLLAAIDESGVKLPPDYRLFGRTFDGIDYRFLKPIKEHYPKDYEKILEWFPLAELEIMRREM